MCLYNAYVDKVIYAILIVGLVVGSVYFAYETYTKRVESLALAELYASVDAATVYEQEVETSLRLGDRRIVVRGVYRNNLDEGLYASFATTTFTTPDAVPYTFALSNVSAGDRIFFRLERVSGEAPSTVPMGPEWHTFDASSIPPEYQGVAVSGPILDNLALFRNGGAAITLLRSYEDDMTFGEPLPRFEYSMAPRVDGESPALASIRSRLLGEGTVSVWTNTSLTGIRHIVFTAPDYTSTTTIKSVNIPLETPLPAAQMQ